MDNITIHAHLTREGGSDYIYSFIELTEEQTQQIADILHIDAADVDSYINDVEYFGDHGDTWISKPYIDIHNRGNLMADVTGLYKYPGFIIAVHETFENLENCAEALSYCDTYTLRHFGEYLGGGKAFGELCDRLTRERDRRQAENDL